MFMLSTVSGTLTASSLAARIVMWGSACRQGCTAPTDIPSGAQNRAHSLPHAKPPCIPRGKKNRLKITWPAKEFSVVNLSTSVRWQRPRGESSMSCNRKVHIVPSRERHFEFGTRPQYIQYSNGVSSPWKGALKIKLEMPILHGGRERKTQDNQPTEYSHLLQPRLIP